MKGAVLLMLAVAGGAGAQGRPDHAAWTVKIGLAGPAVAACSGIGRPRGLDPRGDNFIAVKAGPDLSARRTDTLGPGARFFVCGQSPDGRWTSIVYAPGGVLSPRCGVSAQVASPRRYAGPCYSGWLYTRYVALVR